MEKTWLICSNPLIAQEKTIMENPGPLQELWNKTETGDLSDSVGTHKLP